MPALLMTGSTFTFLGHKATLRFLKITTKFSSRASTKPVFSSARRMNFSTACS